MEIGLILWILLPLIGVFLLVTGIFVWLTSDFKSAVKYLLSGVLCIILAGGSCLLALKDFNPN